MNAETSIITNPALSAEYNIYTQILAHLVRKFIVKVNQRSGLGSGIPLYP